MGLNKPQRLILDFRAVCKIEKVKKEKKGNRTFEELAKLSCVNEHLEGILCYYANATSLI